MSDEDVDAGPTIEELKAAQQEYGVVDHLVYIGRDGFRIAHTDVERVSDQPLTECDLHKWLCELHEAPVAAGVYLALPHQPCAYSENYMAPRWDLELFTVEFF